MTELVDKRRVEDVEQMNCLRDPGIVKLKLSDAYNEIQGHIDQIQYQKENVKEAHQDYGYPPEGQHPGYDNDIRISPVKTADELKRALGELNEYDIWSTEEIASRKQELITECERLSDHLSELNGQQEIIEQKENAVDELAELLEDILELLELAEKEKDY